jgi:hypothetical protein
MKGELIPSDNSHFNKTDRVDLKHLESSYISTKEMKPYHHKANKASADMLMNYTNSHFN